MAVNKQTLVVGVGEVNAVPRGQLVICANKQDFGADFAPKELKARRSCKVHWYGIAATLEKDCPWQKLLSALLHQLEVGPCEQMSIWAAQQA